jgi:hypothetical protein
VLEKQIGKFTAERKPGAAEAAEMEALEAAEAEAGAA